MNKSNKSNKSKANRVRKTKTNRNRNRKQQRGGDGQAGHTVMGESYFGRPALGFSEIQNSPQSQEQVNAMKGGGALESSGHWKQAPTGWENAKTLCSGTGSGDVKFGGSRKSMNNKVSKKGSGKASRKASRKTSKKGSGKASRKASRKASTKH
mgnify:CR=1 FL=1